MILLIGSGPMSIEYAKILNAMEIDYTVVGRGKESAERFVQQTGVNVVTGGVDDFINNNSLSNYTSAIIATGVEALSSTATKLINNGLHNILIEKPAGLNLNEIENLDSHARENNSKVFVAYNRRFFSSVAKAKEIIIEDGGVTSFNFELTEWGHVIEKLQKASGVKENWFLANTTHVADLAFHLGGTPNELSAFTAGGAEWHTRSYCFSGAGSTQDGALFSYQGNWGAPGRWNVEILTKAHRLIFSPMEQLKVQKLGSIQQVELEIDDKYDDEFKPGLYKQVLSFLHSKDSLCTLEEHTKNSKIYNKMAGY